MAPDGKIVYLSYPYIILDNNYTLTDGNLTYNVSSAMRELMDYGDVIATEVVDEVHNSVGRDNFIVFFNESKALFDGHEPDPSPSSTNQDRWMYEVMEVPDINEWIHFNANGHENLASKLVEIVGPIIAAELETTTNTNTETETATSWSFSSFCAFLRSRFSGGGQ